MPTRIAPGDVTGLRGQLPPELLAVLDQLSLSPATTAVWSGGQAAEPMLKSLGKPIQELLDLVLETSEKVKGVPRRLRLSNWDARRGLAQFHPEAPQGQGKGLVGMGVEPHPFEASPAQLDELITQGLLDVQQPPAGQVSAIQSRLRQLLDASLPQFKADQFQKAAHKPVR